MVFHFVHGPNSTLDVLDPHKALVQTQVMAHSILGNTKKTESKKEVVSLPFKPRIYAVGILSRIATASLSLLEMQL